MDDLSTCTAPNLNCFSVDDTAAWSSPHQRGVSVGIAVTTVMLPHTSTGQTPASAKPATPKQQASTALTEKNVEAEPPRRFPLRIPASGPVTLQLQILLDKAGFSPGIIDAAWGINAAKAITFFTKPDDNARFTGDSPPTVTSIDRATYERAQSAAQSSPLLRWYTVTRGDLAGPFTPIPESVYQQAKSLPLLLIPCRTAF